MWVSTNIPNSSRACKILAQVRYLGTTTGNVGIDTLAMMAELVGLAADAKFGFSIKPCLNGISSFIVALTEHNNLEPSAAVTKVASRW